MGKFQVLGYTKPRAKHIGKSLVCFLFSVKNDYLCKRLVNFFKVWCFSFQHCTFLLNRCVPKKSRTKTRTIQYNILQNNERNNFANVKKIIYLLSNDFNELYLFKSQRGYKHTFLYWRCGHQRTKSRTILVKINDFCTRKNFCVAKVIFLTIDELFFEK